MDTTRTLLIVDDNPADHVLIRRLLSQELRQRYTYYGAELAASALEIIATTPIDCLLLDYNLPDSSGLEVLADLRQERSGLTPMAVVMLTGFGDETLAVQALQAGAMDYLVKERLSGPRLAQAVADAIHHHQLRAEFQRRQRYLEQHTLGLERRVAELHERLAEELGRAELLAALEAERASLAQRVAERTADLRAANTELARAARMKDEFLANMSHELRTPLNAILGRSELLREQIYGPLSAQQDRAVQSIEEAGQHLLAMINDILDLSKVEAGKLALELDSFNPKDVCRAALRLVAEAAGAKGITLAIAYDSIVELVEADARRLKQILVNLLSNAVKFTPAGGRVGLEMRGDTEQQIVSFVVWDTGIGIAQEDQQRLFKPFVQLDSTLSRQYEGTGLGLALVFRLAELHGGSVTLESAVGEGSRFTVRLPWTPPAESGSPEEYARPAALAPLDRRLRPALGEALGVCSPAAPRPVILLAEDSLHNVRVLEDFLVAMGYQVEVASNGVEAIAQAGQLRPDLIVMDVQMPYINGMEATRRIRAAGLDTTPIIALTALAMPGDRERCLDAGANEYLTKPVSLRALNALIRRLLELQ